MGDFISYENTHQQALDSLSNAEDTLFQTVDQVLSALEALGLGSIAASLKQASQSAHQTCQSATDEADRAFDLRRPVECCDSIVEALKTKFAVALSHVSTTVGELEGRSASYWEGTGASVYTSHTDTQKEAASELSNKAIQVADILLQEAASIKTLTNQILAAICGAASGFVAGCVSLIPPATPVGITIILLTIAASLAALAAIIVAFDARQRDLEKSLADLMSLPASGGSTQFGNGHWPSHMLYS